MGVHSFVPRLLRRIAGVSAAAVIFAGTGLVEPSAATASPNVPPSVTLSSADGPAQAWLVADLNSGRILASRNANTPHAPASTIKVLLAMVVLDHIHPNTPIVASAKAADVECSCAGVEAGRAYTARQLLEALLLVSGNDAANVLGEALGGQEVAVARMTAKAHQVGARSTRAATPSGLDGPGVQTTPHDLAVIFRAALKYPMFAHIIRAPSAMFPEGDGFRTIVNQNKLLERYPGTLGGKTGYTRLARKTYVGAAQRNGKQLVVVQMYGSDEPGRTYWDQAIRLFDWGFRQ